MAGATGAIGKPLVAQLIAAGNEVTGMTRLEERAEAVVHQLTGLPHEFSARYGYGATSELRTRTSSRNAACPHGRTLHHVSRARVAHGWLHDR